MDVKTLGLLVLSFILAIGISWYQYLYKSKNKINKYLFVLRTIIFFGIFLLILNPKITRNTLDIVKPTLVIGLDNSRSIKELNQNKVLIDLNSELNQNKELNEKFDIQTYIFDQDSRISDSITFNGNQTRIDKLAKNLSSVYKNKTYPTILISDGNQTIGTDYVYSFNQNNKVFPIVLGDTLAHLDLKINHLNANKYAFLKNKFPVEVFLGYQGDKTIDADFVIKQGNQVVFKKAVNFNKNNKSVVIEALLEANKVGIQVYQAQIISSENEKNKYNNIKNFAVEVIDQRTEVLIISDITHPDLGALKRSIESNEQNKVTIQTSQKIAGLADYDVVVLYQPSQGFKQIFSEINNSNKNYFLITGKNTDFNFLNTIQDDLKVKASNQTEDYLADYNASFSSFAQNDIGYSEFPPLENFFGNIEIKVNYHTLLQAKIRSINTEKPLLFYTDSNSQRTSVLLGEGIWKWRLNYFTKHENFDEFDKFINKTIQYLATNNKKKSLIVTHENFYNSGENIEISAQYFNKNYEFDQNAQLTLTLRNKETNQSKSFDLLISNNYYKVNLDGLTPGNYSFSVKEISSNSNYSGSFEVIDFDIEKQFTNADFNKLSQLAQNTNGKVFFENQTKELINHLVNDEDFKVIQKENSKKVPLIDFWVLLALLIFALSVEWFVRKYNGLL